MNTVYILTIVLISGTTATAPPNIISTDIAEKAMSLAEVLRKCNQPVEIPSEKPGGPPYPVWMSQSLREPTAQNAKVWFEYHDNRAAPNGVVSIDDYFTVFVRRGDGDSTFDYSTLTFSERFKNESNSIKVDGWLIYKNRNTLKWFYEKTLDWILEKTPDCKRLIS